MISRTRGEPSVLLSRHLAASLEKPILNYISQSKSISIQRKDGELFDQIRHTASGLEMIIEWCCEMKRWMNQRGRGTYNDSIDMAQRLIGEMADCIVQIANHLMFKN